MHGAVTSIDNNGILWSTCQRFCNVVAIVLKCSVPYIARWGLHSGNWQSSNSIGPRITTHRWGMLSVLELKGLNDINDRPSQLPVVCMACCGSHDTSVTLSFRLQLWYSIKTRIDLNHLLKLGGHHTSSVYWGEECSLDFIFSLQYMEHLQQAIQVAPHTFWDEMWLKAILSWIFTSHCGLGQNTCDYRPGRGRDFRLLPSPADYLDVTLGPLSCKARSTKRPLLPEQILSSQSTRHKNRTVSS